ncbi:MAG TPA: ABC transporter substrate-binding protein [Candidatus Limnocylindria bacterium]|nr:ABC transporter substrate-binding protein [Candidatus Limnocylindria bacterium]
MHKRARLGPSTTRILAPLLTLVILVVACGPAGSPATPGATGGAAAGAPVSGGTLTYGQNFPIQIADPHNQKGSADHAIFFNVYDRLVELDQQTLQPKPSLATSWKATSDTSWELKLRTDVKFSDGTPFNAAAAKESLDRAMNSASAKAFTGNFASVEAPDASTLVIKTKTPYAQTIFNLGVGQLSIVAPSAMKQGNEWLATHAIGSGPYLLTEWTPNERFVLERNPSYWGPKPYLDKIVIKMLTNDSSRLAALQSGDVDVAVAPPAQSVKGLGTDANLAVVRSPQVSVWFVMYNLQDPVMRNLKFRQALNLAVNREALNTQACEGLLRTATSWLPPESLGGKETDPGVKLEYNPDKAKQLLAESGVNLSSVKLSIVPQVPLCGDPVILAIQEDLRKVGVASDIVKVDAVTANDRYQKGQYQLGPQGWQALDPDSSLRRTWSDKGPFAYPHVGRPDFESKIDQASSTLDDAKRYGLYKDIFKQMLDEAWFMPVFYQMTIVAQTKKLQGIRYFPILGTPLFGGAWLSK